MDQTPASSGRPATVGRPRPDGYGESFAEVYDEWYGKITDEIATAKFVAERCNELPVLELGVGTGRLAEPLCRAGVSVVGIDASAAMLARCAARGLGLSLSLIQADMAALAVRGRFGAALIAFNTLFNLPSAAEQQLLFTQVHSLLDPDGVLIVEALDPAGLTDAPCPFDRDRTRDRRWHHRCRHVDRQRSADDFRPTCCSGAQRGTFAALVSSLVDASPDRWLCDDGRL